MVCWLVCAGWVCGARTYLNAVWCFGCIEMDWLACDCVQLFGFLIFDPVGLRELYFFFVVIFLDASTGFCGLWWFVLLLGFGLFTACFGFVLKFFCGEFDPGSGRTLAACLTHASRTERPPCGVLEWRTGE